MRKVFSAQGAHCLCELTHVSYDTLRMPDFVVSLIRSALTQAGFNVLGEQTHRFPEPGGGFTAIILLAESHASIHTYPEHGYAALDLFTCGQIDPLEAAQQLCEQLSPEGYTLRRIERGP